MDRGKELNPVATIGTQTDYSFYQVIESLQETGLRARERRATTAQLVVTTLPLVLVSGKVTPPLPSPSKEEHQMDQEKEIDVGIESEKDKEIDIDIESEEDKAASIPLYSKEEMCVEVNTTWDQDTCSKGKETSPMRKQNTNSDSEPSIPNPPALGSDNCIAAAGKPEKDSYIPINRFNCFPNQHFDYEHSFFLRRL